MFDCCLPKKKPEQEPLLDQNNPDGQAVVNNPISSTVEGVNNIINVQQDGYPNNQSIPANYGTNISVNPNTPVKPVDNTNFDFVLVTPTNNVPILKEITDDSVQSPVVPQSEIKHIDSSPIKSTQNSNNNLPVPVVAIESKPEITPIKSPETISPVGQPAQQSVQNVPDLSPIKTQQTQPNHERHQQQQQPIQQQQQPVQQQQQPQHQPVREQYVQPEPVQPPTAASVVNPIKKDDIGVEPVPLPSIIQPPPPPPASTPPSSQQQQQQQQQPSQQQPMKHRNDFETRRDSLDVTVKDELINNYVTQKSITGINTKVLKTVTISENDNNAIPSMIEEDENEDDYEDRARSSLSKGYNVIKHCGGLSKPHETFMILADDELTWRRKGNKDFASIPLKDITKINVEDKTVIIKGKSRDLEIDIENPEDRKEFCDSLNGLIKHLSYVPPTPPQEEQHRTTSNKNNNNHSENNSMINSAPGSTPIQFRNSSLSAPITPMINNTFTSSGVGSSNRNSEGSFNSTSTTPNIMLSPEPNRKELIDNFVQQKHDNNQECKVVLQSVVVSEATIPPSIMEETQENRAERARSSLSRGYNVMKHCGGFSKPHETFIILSGDELTWRRKGNKDFASIPLNDISSVKTDGKKVTIKSKSRNLEIDIENEDDRTEFAESLNELIKH